jgi:hypothetical protein
MVCTVQDEVVGADYGLCVLRGEVLPVWDVLWERVEAVVVVVVEASALAFLFHRVDNSQGTGSGEIEI